MLRGLIFDMDGVILDNAQQHIRAFAIFLAQYGIERPFTPDMFGRRNESIFELLMPEVVAKQGWRELSKEKERIYREIFREEYKPIPGLTRLLTTATENDIKCGIGSSACRENIEFAIDICHIEPYISAWCCEDDVEVGKPAPDVYLRCAERLGLRPEECVVFEDATAGITAGKRAGCKVVALTTSCSRELLEATEADLIIDDFRDVTLDQLRALVG